MTHHKHFFGAQLLISAACFLACMRLAASPTTAPAPTSNVASNVTPSATPMAIREITLPAMPLNIDVINPERGWLMDVHLGRHHYPVIYDVDDYRRFLALMSASERRKYRRDSQWYTREYQPRKAYYDGLYRQVNDAPLKIYTEQANNQQPKSFTDPKHQQAKYIPEGLRKKLSRFSDTRPRIDLMRTHMGHSVVNLFIGMRSYIDDRGGVAFAADKAYQKALRQQLKQLRVQGLKAVVTVSYSSSAEAYGRAGDDPAFKYAQATDPADAKIIIAHIRALAELLNEHKEVIMAVKLGFVGAYGEYHSSMTGLMLYCDKSELLAWRKKQACADNAEPEDQPKIKQRAGIVKAVLESFAPQIHILFRTPFYKLEHYQQAVKQRDEASPLLVFNPLTINDISQDGLNVGVTASQRLGYYNDGIIMADDANYYLVEEPNDTFFSDILGQHPYATKISKTTRAQQYKTIRKLYYHESKFVLNGGEFGMGLGEHSAPSFGCDEVVQLLKQRRISFLDRLLGFEDGGVYQHLSRRGQARCIDEMGARLGYRLVVKRIQYRVTAANQLALRVVIENHGFAAPMQNRPIMLQVQNTDHPKQHKRMQYRGENRHMRTWLPSGNFEFSEAEVADTTNEIILQQRFDLSDLVEGEYKVSLSLPDSNLSLQGDSRYAIRLANQGMWTEDSFQQDGLNHLFTLSLP